MPNATDDLAVRQATWAGFCGKSLGRPGWACTRPRGHEFNLLPCHALGPFKLDWFSQLRWYAEQRATGSGDA